MEKLEKIATHNRAVINDFIKAKGLVRAQWCKSAGVAEATLRNFLNGTSKSLNTASLGKLGAVVNVSITIQNERITITDLNDNSSSKDDLEWILKTLKEDLPDATNEQKARTAMRLYNHLYPDQPISFDYTLGKVEGTPAE